MVAFCQLCYYKMVMKKMPAAIIIMVITISNLSCSTAGQQFLLCRNSYLLEQTAHRQSLDTETVSRMMADPG